MKYKVEFEFEAGKYTCGTKWKTMCEHYRPGFEKEFCDLFCTELLENENGWILRHNKCLEKAKRIKE